MKEQKNPEGSSLAMLISHWKNGTFSEIIEDWKWIFHYSIRYKGAIAVYVLLEYSVLLWGLQEVWRENI